MVILEAVGLPTRILCDLLIPSRRNILVPSHLLDPWFAASLLVLLRVVRAWNQTGQKHAGEPDIATTILPKHNMLLWFVILVTYFNMILRLSRMAVPWAPRHLATAASLFSGITALGFKVAFTKADVPELFEGFGYLSVALTEDVSLVAQARAVFTSIAALAILTSFSASCRKIPRKGRQKGRS